MRINELPKWLQDIAIQRCKEYCKKYGINFETRYNKDWSDDIVLSFNWEETIERGNFWVNIDNGIIPTEQEYYSKFKFDGADIVPERDNKRLTKQYDAIFNLMKDGEWRTLNQIASQLGYGEASISAQLRHTRKERNGGHTLNREYVGDGLYQYQLIVKQKV